MRDAFTTFYVLRTTNYVLSCGFKCHSTLFRFEEGNCKRIYLAELEFLAKLVFAREFGDVYEAGDAFLDGSECAMFVVLDDHCIDHLVFCELCRRRFPRVVHECSDG